MSDDKKVVKLLAAQEIKESMADPKFYEQLPEFLPLQAKLKTLNIDPTAPRGCSACAKSKSYAMFGNEYMNIAAGLNEDARTRLLKYFKADELRGMMLDPRTHGPKTLRISGIAYDRVDRQ